MAEGKQRFAEYKQDKADGSVNWAQEGKDAMKDWKPQVCAACSDAKYCKSIATVAGTGSISCVRMQGGAAPAAPQ